jgi:hypothetical protein
MKRFRRWIYVLALIFIGAGGSVYYQDALSDFLGVLLERSRRATFGEGEAPALAPTVPVTMFFASLEGDRLVRVPVQVEKGASATGTIRNAIEALIAGPADETAAPVVPPGAKIRALFPGPDAALYVDFDRTFSEAHSGGAWSELLTVQAVANTVLGNFGDTFERVILLIDGQQAETLAGALTIAGPLRFRGDLVTAAAAEAAPEKPEKPAEPEAPPSAVGLPSAPVGPVGAPQAGPVGAPSEKGPVGAPSGGR